ncbi:MAG: thiamine-phosphate kinase [Cyanobacteria bacterium SIG30]|nr:thiamine-phosphate kinase [Cyanobacteria bacterium SIG30]
MNYLNTKEQVFLQIISKTLNKNSYLGDDCAFLKKEKLAITQDTLVENVHFDLSFITPFELGYKACIVNVSDILVSGAKPKYITVSLSGNLEEKFVEEFYKGINKACKDFKIEVIGGDLTKGEKITISICAIGSAENRKISSRKNAKENYIVATKGFFGSSAYYLETKDENFKEAHIKPTIFPKLLENVAKKTKKPYVAMDSSDGLIDCLMNISKQSNIGFEIEYNKIPKKIKNKDLVLYGGEDFCPVIVLHKNDFKKIKGLKAIGKTTKKMGIFIDGEDYSDKKWRGFEHFE